MIPATTNLEDLTLAITQEIDVEASLETTFAALLEEMGPLNTGPDGEPLPMRLEAWPGGRWFRDLGDGNGHLWGHVQAIKRPTLVEITGPLFASYPLLSNVQYRLVATSGGTKITLRHTALGFMQADQKQGVSRGWQKLLERVRAHAHSK